MENYEKKYKEALERMKSWARGEHPECFTEAQKTAEFIFPELKESEDERIRKELISHLKREYVVKKNVSDVEYDEWIAWLEKQGKKEYALKSFKDEDVHKFMQYFEKQAKAYEIELPNRSYDIYGLAKDILAWLEKQGEQKPVNKDELKFKVGDWILLDKPCQIESVDKHGNYLVKYCDDEGISTLSRKFCETYFHLWTIQDAKDGDVLVTNDGNIFIYRKHDNNDNNYVYYYYSTNYYDSISLNSSWNTFGIKAATKEQRDILFQKMKEAGCEWNFEKKELKNIPNALEECEIEHIEHGKYYYCIKDYYYGGNKKVSKGEVVQALNGMSVMALGVKANEYFLPVNSIKQKHAWIKEDALIISKINRVLNAQEYHDGATGIKMNPYNDALDWLKSLKGRYTWKPSDEQLEALDSATENCACSEYQDCLRKLIEQLKKLREE